MAPYQPYSQGPVDIEKVLGVEQIAPGKYRGRAPLTKPAGVSRGAYGGFIAGQALIAVIESAPEGFVPHSLQSYFVAAVIDDSAVEWDVEEISHGKTFCNSHVRGFQGGKLKYYGNVSLTRKNSHADSLKEYDDWLEKKKNAPKDDDDDDEAVVTKPFEFQTPLHDWLSKHTLDELPLDARTENILVYHKMLPELAGLTITKDENDLEPAERRLSWFVKWGADEEGVHQPIINVKGAYQYAGLAVLSDSLFLTRLARTLRSSEVDHNDLVHYFSVSLDHIMYFHDTDFDTTKWMGFSFKVMRMVNNRAVLEAEMYNDKGVHVATIIQEGLVFLNGVQDHAKL